MEVSSWLHSAVSQLVIQNVSMLSNSTPNGSQELVSSLQQASANGNKSSNTLTRGGAALDLSFLVRILSMTSPDKFQLVSQLIGLSIQMVIFALIY